MTETSIYQIHNRALSNVHVRVICDSWLCLDFPLPESGQNLLLKASNLRRTWNKLLANKLEALSRNLDSELTANQRATESNRLEAELWQNLANYMNCEIGYTLKRLLPADLKVCQIVLLYTAAPIVNSFHNSQTLYVGQMCDADELLGQFVPNPFANDFECTRNDMKGGIYITENILYGRYEQFAHFIEVHFGKLLLQM